MRTFAVVTALFLACCLLVAEAQRRPLTEELIRTKRQVGTMNCLLYGICGTPKDYRGFNMNKKYGPYYHNNYYKRSGHGRGSHFSYGRRP